MDTLLFLWQATDFQPMELEPIEVIWGLKASS